MSQVFKNPLDVQVLGPHNPYV